MSQILRLSFVHGIMGPVDMRVQNTGEELDIKTMHALGTQLASNKQLGENTIEGVRHFCKGFLEQLDNERGN